MTNESPRVSSCISKPVSLAETYPWEFDNETPDIVKDFFRAVGIMNVLDEDDFAHALYEQFRFDATDYLETIARMASRDKRAAILKLRNVELVLAVASQLDAARYEAYFSWLAAANLPQPTRVLDIGCDIGLSTCFQATLFPHVTITGIDESEDAIECAKKLAAKLKLTNVVFIRGDVGWLPNNLKGQKFDLVFASHVADQLSDTLLDHDDTVEDVLAWQRPSDSSYYKTPHAQPLADLLADDKAILVSFEAFGTPHYLAEWLRSLRDAGVYLPWADVDFVDYLNTEHDCYDDLFVMIGSKQTADLPTADEIRSLWIGGPDNIPDQDVYEGVMAESVLVATEPKECQAEIMTEIAYNELVCCDLWETSSHVLIYQHSDEFGLKLVRLKVDDPKRCIELLTEAFDLSKKNA